MKKSFSLREMALLGLLLIIIFYYFVVQLPIQSEMEDIASQQTQVLADIDEKTTMLTMQKKMQNEIDEIFKESDGNPEQMPEYDNSDALILELNSILESASDYSISFRGEDRETSSYVVRRQIQLSYVTGDYGSAVEILNMIAGSSYKNQIGDLSISDGSYKTTGNDGDVDVSLTLTYFEYNAS